MHLNVSQSDVVLCLATNLKQSPPPPPPPPSPTTIPQHAQLISVAGVALIGSSRAKSRSLTSCKCCSAASKRHCRDAVAAASHVRISREISHLRFMPVRVCIFIITRFD